MKLKNQNHLLFDFFMVEKSSHTTASKMKSEKGSRDSAVHSQYFYAVGKRKTSVARVYLVHGHKGKIQVNGKDCVEYFSTAYTVENISAPLLLTHSEGKFDIRVVVQGGGISSQSDAVRHGIAKALELIDPGYRPILKQAGYLTRDSRSKERKKFGKHGARRSPQWAKR
jgi:small subunit ribosomal protein S9